MMLHGLGDCTPERNCGCMAKSPSRDALRERIARALWDSERERGIVVATWDEVREIPAASAFLNDADAVIAALGLGPAVERYGAQESDGTVYGWEPDVETVRREWRGMPVMRCRFYVTPWERIEDEDTP